MNFLTYLFYGLPSFLVLVWWMRRRRRLEKISIEVHEETRAAGLTESASLHPIIDPMRCIGCSNCVLACPFGVPQYVATIDQMMKCDMCFDRTSIGKRPMCATVCPSQALFFGPREDVEKIRRERPVNEVQFGEQTVRTKVNMMVAPEMDALDFDIMEHMSEEIVYV